MRGALQPPLTGRIAASVGVIGTWALDADFEAGACGSIFSSPICCCFYAGVFRVPYPCNCCGAECCCCPHAPSGVAFQSARARGLDALIAEAGRLAMESVMLVPANGMTPEGGQIPRHVLLGNARAELFEQRWTARANSFLKAFGLRVAVFNWIEARRDGKGNTIGEGLRCALQFYNAATFDGAGGFGVLSAGLTGINGGTAMSPASFEQAHRDAIAPLAPMAPIARMPVNVPPIISMKTSAMV